jgi:paraquat-inducible protein B
MNKDDKLQGAAIADAPVSRSTRRISAIWIVPLVAALLGVSMVWQHYASKGPLATVWFETAEGVTAGKTKVLRRNVEVGTVEAVRLSTDLQGVVMTLRIDKDARDLLRQDTRFWVVRPRVGGGGISGLGTIVSGAFLEVDPGLSKVPEKEFVGMEQPPVTALGVPGLRLTLLADETGSLGVGSSVTYKGIAVGRVENRTFDFEVNRVEFDIFIDDTYKQLVSSATRFWNTTGVDMELGAEGLRVRTGSLESILVGGVEFDTPALELGPSPVADGTRFPLYKNRSSIDEGELKPRLTYLLLFSDSVRGLSEEAPVEFRGIRVGKVTGISFDYAPDDPEHRVPVLIQIDPSAITSIPAGPNNAGAELVAASVKRGLRATLKTGSLLTGQLFVNLKIDPDALAAEVGKVGNYRTLPTTSSGLSRLEDKLVVVLDKLQQLPLENTLNGATEALEEIKTAAATLKGAASELEALLASDGMKNLPTRIDSTLLGLNKTLEGFEPESVLYQDLTGATEELRDSLRSIRVLADSLERKPNALIFGRGSSKVKPPQAKK